MILSTGSIRALITSQPVDLLKSPTFGRCCATIHLLLIEPPINYVCMDSQFHYFKSRSHDSRSYNDVPPGGKTKNKLSAYFQRWVLVVEAWLCAIIIE